MDIEIKESKIHGKGVFAKRDFKQREIVLKWNPRELSKEDLAHLSEEDEGYIITIKNKKYLMQSPEKYVNSSKDCNTNADLDNFCDIAIKDIKKGEEITSNYDK